MVGVPVHLVLQGRACGVADGPPEGLGEIYQHFPHDIFQTHRVGPAEHEHTRGGAVRGRPLDEAARNEGTWVALHLLDAVEEATVLQGEGPPWVAPVHAGRDEALCGPPREPVEGRGLQGRGAVKDGQRGHDLQHGL